MQDLPASDGADRGQARAKRADKRVQTVASTARAGLVDREHGARVEEVAALLAVLEAGESAGGATCLELQALGGLPARAALRTP